jgi:hypothetical protein
VIATNKLEFGAKVSFGLEVASSSVCRNVTIIECLLERTALLLPPVTPHQEVKGERRGIRRKLYFILLQLGEGESHPNLTSFN